jgi:hypothetical protein
MKPLIRMDLIKAVGGAAKNDLLVRPGDDKPTPIPLDNPRPRPV